MTKAAKALNKYEAIRATQLLARKLSLSTFVGARAAVRHLREAMVAMGGDDAAELVDGARGTKKAG